MTIICSIYGKPWWRGRTADYQLRGQWCDPTCPVSNVSNFVHFTIITLPVSFGCDPKSRWSFVSYVHDKKSKRFHAGINM